MPLPGEVPELCACCRPERMVIWPRNGQTPLFVAADRVHLEVVRLLIEADVDFDRADHNFVRLVDIATRKQHFEVALLLVNAANLKPRIDQRVGARVD